MILMGWLGSDCTLHNPKGITGAVKPTQTNKISHRRSVIFYIGYHVVLINFKLPDSGNPWVCPLEQFLTVLINKPLIRHSITWSRLVFRAGLGGSVGCAIRLETRRLWFQPPPRSATFFCGDWSWNIFYGHSLPSADSRRAFLIFDLKEH